MFIDEASHNPFIALRQALAHKAQDRRIGGIIWIVDTLFQQTTCYTDRGVAMQSYGREGDSIASFEHLEEVLTFRKGAKKYYSNNTTYIYVAGTFPPAVMALLQQSL